MKSFFYFVLFILLLVLGATFTIQNPQDVSVQYYMGFTWRGPLIIVISASLAAGIAIGCLAGLAKNFRLKRRISRLEKSNPAVTGNKSHSTVVENSNT